MAELAHHAERPRKPALQPMMGVSSRRGNLTDRHPPSPLARFCTAFPPLPLENSQAAWSREHRLRASTPPRLHKRGSAPARLVRTQPAESSSESSSRAESVDGSQGPQVEDGEQQEIGLSNQLDGCVSLNGPFTPSTIASQAATIGPSISSHIRSTCASNRSSMCSSPMRRSEAQLMADYEWDARAYMTAASKLGDPVEKSFRIEMAIASWDKSLALARSLGLAHSRPWAKILLGRAGSHMRLAASLFGSDRSREHYTLAIMDASAVLEVAAHSSQAILIRARASIALACSDFTQDDAERNTRLEHAARDLSTLQAAGIEAGNAMGVHTAVTWANAAPAIAKHFTAEYGLPFPEVVADVTVLAVRLSREAASQVPTHNKPSTKHPNAERVSEPAEQGALLVSPMEDSQPDLLIRALKQRSSHVRLAIVWCAIGVALASCLLALVRASPPMSL